MRTVDLQAGSVELIDQTALPDSVKIIECRDIDEIVDAIRTMKVRGAPAIGAAAAFGMVLSARRYLYRDNPEMFLVHLQQMGDLLKSARPTAVNLAWAVDRQLAVARRHLEGKAEDDQDAVLQTRASLVAEARDIADEDIAKNERLGKHGAALIPDEARVLTHCNTGSLATVEFGTALGVIRSAVRERKRVHVLVDETRPLMQGARLTAWELQEDGIPFTLIADSMAGHFISRGEVDLVIVGADRIAANGDVANKIGTYTLAVLCKENGIPFYVAAPTTTIDLAIASGTEIPIEQRDQREVTHVGGVRIAPIGVTAANPAFDVTPSRYVTAIITETGVLRAPYEASLREAVAASEPERAARAAPTTCEQVRA
jgi:methylthioribose-1-phosphate isomerase